MSLQLGPKSRVLIVGTSGSGKSTLARAISEKFGIADVELDALYWGPNWTGAPADEFKSKIEASISKNEGWVVHGNYSKVQNIILSRATAIIWLDYSLLIVLWRVYKRSVLRIIFRTDLWAGNRESFRKTFLSRSSIILWAYQTYSLRREQYEKLFASLERSELQLFRFKKPNETESFLKCL
jgi:adenylate kinase family enzyme